MIKYINCKTRELNTNEKNDLILILKRSNLSGNPICHLTCKKCSNRYYVYQNKKTPSRYAFKNICECGNVIMEYNTTEEPDIIKIN